MICWYCYWGWPKQVHDIYDKHLALLDGDDGPLDFGCGHIVWADENFDDDSIQWCIDHESEHSSFNETPEDHRIAVASLKELLLVPEDIRCCEPDGYDGEHPENFPPPAGIVMVGGSHNSTPPVAISEPIRIGQ